MACENEKKVYSIHAISQLGLQYLYNVRTYISYVNKPN